MFTTSKSKLLLKLYVGIMLILRSLTL